MKPVRTASIVAGAALACLAQGAVAAPAPGPACPAERAVYALESEGETFRLAFAPARNAASMASDLYLKLSTPRRDYWFKFNVSQGYSGISAFPVTDPYAPEADPDGPRDLLGEPYGANPDAPAEPDVLAALRFYPLDENLAVMFEPPMSGDEAPPYLMFPEIGLALWYFPEALTDDPNAERDPMPRGVFVRAECLADEPAKAFP